MKLNNLHDALVHDLQDLFSAENQLLLALPKMAQAAANEELSAAFEDHLEETEGHIERLEEALNLLDATTGGEKCKAMEGLILEGQKILEEDANDVVRDALIISIAQKVEHYEIAGYGTARTFAELLGEKEVADLLQETLNEEAAADEALTEIAESVVNKEAEMADTE